MADAPETLKMLNEFKQQLKAKVKHMEKKSLLVQFPDDPEKLPKEIYDRVFGEELPSPPKGSAGGGVIESGCEKITWFGEEAVVIQ